MSGRIYLVLIVAGAIASWYLALEPTNEDWALFFIVAFLTVSLGYGLEKDIDQLKDRVMELELNVENLARDLELCADNARQLEAKADSL